MIKELIKLCEQQFNTIIQDNVIKIGNIKLLFNLDEKSYFNDDKKNCIITKQPIVTFYKDSVDYAIYKERRFNIDIYKLGDSDCITINIPRLDAKLIFNQLKIILWTHIC